MFDTIKRGISLVERGSRLPWVIVIGLAIIVSGLEALGALLILFVVGTVTRPDAAYDLPVLGDLRDRFPGVNEATLFRYIAVGIGVFFVVRAVAFLGQILLQYRAAYRTGVSVSGRMLSGYLRMPYVWHLQHNSAHLMRNVSGSVNEVVAQVLAPTVMLLSQALVVLALVTVLVLAAPLATLLVGVVLGGTVFTILRIVQPRLLELGRAHQVNTRRGIKAAQQSLHGVRDIKLLGREDYFRSEFEQAQLRMGRTQYLRQTFLETPRIVLETVVIALLLTFIAISGVGTETTEESLALVGLFAYAALRLIPAVNRMVTQLNNIRFGTAAAKIVSDDLAMLDAAEAARMFAEGQPLVLRDRIAIEHVSFRYQSSIKDVLHDIDFSIRAGESIGFVGSTGGGKTTLVDVILGLLEPSTGSVKVDGVDIQSVLPAWQANLGVVSQAQFLTDDALRRNIALGLRDDEIDDGAVEEAIALAQLEDFVRSLPEGLETVVGERGVRLSGGQRQRVAIARALYRRPSVLVFDEGTSALDNQTEADLIRALETLRGERTMLIVAHRLTTVQDCDRIVVLEDGRVVDIGTYDELTERSPIFQAIAR